MTRTLTGKPVEIIDVWITKHALTSGIVKSSAEVVGDRTMVRLRTRDYPQYFHKNDWHRTEGEAKAHAEKMRTEKLASLKKQLAKIEALKF